MEQRKAIRGHGTSIHSLPALPVVPATEWLQIAMIRMNHKGAHMDGPDYHFRGPGDINEVVDHVHQAKAEGLGVISMKLIGEGSFTDRSDRQQALRFAFRNAGVDSVTVGYKTLPKSTKQSKTSTSR